MRLKVKSLSVCLLSTNKTESLVYEDHTRSQFFVITIHKIKKSRRKGSALKSDGIQRDQNSLSLNIFLLLNDHGIFFLKMINLFTINLFI